MYCNAPRFREISTWLLETLKEPFERRPVASEKERERGCKFWEMVKELFRDSATRVWVIGV